jgi:putative ABC transport system substrate-binding protein
MTAFHQGLSQLGFVEGANVDIDYRSAEGQPGRLSALAEDLVQHRVAVIVTPDSSAPALAAKAATNIIPIVFATGVDPVARGLVASLARPGGNVTGLYVLTVGLISKRVELLHRVIPTATSIALLQAYKAPGGSQEEEGETAARALGLNPVVLYALNKDEIEPAIASLTTQRVGALLVGAHPLFRTHKDQIVALAARHAIPAGYESTIFTTAGGLTSYGPDDSDIGRQIGIYTGRILRGAKPTDLPVIQPTKFDFAINLKTARSLGIEIPPDLLAIADQVIE